jgi:hypothetical protein
MVKTLDEEPALFIGRKVHRSSHDSHPLCPEHVTYRIEKATAHLLVVYRFKESKEPCPFVMKIYVPPVDDGDHPSQGLPRPSGKKTVYLCMPEKRVSW